MLIQKIFRLYCCVYIYICLARHQCNKTIYKTSFTSLPPSSPFSLSAPNHRECRKWQQRCRRFLALAPISQHHKLTFNFSSLGYRQFFPSFFFIFILSSLKYRIIVVFSNQLSHFSSPIDLFLICQMLCTLFCTYTRRRGSIGGLYLIVGRGGG